MGEDAAKAEPGRAQQAALARAQQLLAGARRLVVLTGAGVSAESGVLTFRGSEGLWRRYRPEQLATPEAFARQPRLVWEWYAWRRELVSRCRPNPAHRALARAALRAASRASAPSLPAERQPAAGSAPAPAHAPAARDGSTGAGAPPLRIITQNVDGLHALAARELAAELGCSPGPALPLELHGNLFSVRCTGCGVRRPHREPIDASSRERLPRCAGCGALLRPDVVWFGEPLDPGLLAAAFTAAAEAELCLVVGTSGVVQPAASVALTALEAGGALIEINPEPTPLSALATVALRGPAGTLVPALLGSGG